MKAGYLAPLFVLKAALLFLGSLAAVYSGIMMNAASSGSQQWPSVPGTVLEGRVVEEKQHAGPGGGSLICYRAGIRYVYAVQGISYRNERISYHGSRCIGGRRGKRLAEELLDRYPSGGPVRVFHDPDDPRRSCLQPGKTGDGTGMFMLGGFVFLAFLVYGGGRALDRYGGTGDFVLHGKSGEAVYEETIGPPARVYAWAVSAAVLLAWFAFPLLVRLVLMPGSLSVDRIVEYLAYLLSEPPLAFLLAAVGMTAVLLLLFNSRTISCSRSGILLPVGPFRPRRLIPADAIVSCEGVEYPAGAGGWLRKAGNSDGSTRIIRVVGYRGPAVLLRYNPSRVVSPFFAGFSRQGGREEGMRTAGILFPCRQPSHVCSLVSRIIDF